MAIATRPKPKAHHKKRQAAHHRQSKHYIKAYLPYLPMLAIVGIGLLVNNFWERPAHVLGAATDLTSQNLLITTNQQRQANHEASLSFNPQLEAAAQAKANDMVRRNYWSHITPDGKQPWTFVAASGYQYQAAGENLAYGFNSADTTLSGWMHSAEHRANILNTSYQNVGFGVASSANYIGSGPETVIVALYGEPAGASSSASSPVSTPAAAQPVTRMQLASYSASWNVTIVALVGSIAIIMFLVRHGLAWRRTMVQGELFVLTHPRFDMLLVGLAVVCILLNHTVGFIH